MDIAACSRAVAGNLDLDAIADVGEEELQVPIIHALEGFRLGANFLLTAAKALIQRSDLSPFHAVLWECCRHAEGRRKQLRAQLSISRSRLILQVPQTKDKPVDDKAPRRPPVLVEGQNVITTAVVERPLAERPSHDAIPNIAEWLIGGARLVKSCVSAIDEYAWRLSAAGLPLLRFSLHGGTLHPQFIGNTYLWWRTTGATREVMITHEVVDLFPYEINPVARVQRGGEILRRHLDGPTSAFDFPILHELRAAGATDYYALPVTSAFGGHRYMATYVCDRSGGFSDREIKELTWISERLSVVADMHSQRRIAENVLKAYLGPQTGSKVLAGQIRRGAGEAISAVLWSSDLRRFTRLSDHLPGERMIALLNQLFDLQAHAIVAHGGEVLKFIGDGLLAIFPVASPEQAAKATANALAAAAQALKAVGAMSEETQPANEEPIEIVIALHYGTVIYGNIGAADRLDFTVIGPAVNLVSRVEGVAKALDRALVVSDDFARAYGGALTSLGSHYLRGLGQPHELFAPPPV